MKFWTELRLFVTFQTDFSGMRGQARHFQKFSNLQGPPPPCFSHHAGPHTIFFFFQNHFYHFITKSHEFEHGCAEGQCSAVLSFH